MPDSNPARGTYAWEAWCASVWQLKGKSLSLSPSRPWQPRQWPRISRHPCRSPPDCRTRTPEEIRNKCELLFAITPLLQLRKQIWMKIKHRNSSIVFIERIRVKIRIRVLIRSGYGSGFDEFHWKFNYTGNRKKMLIKNSEAEKW